MSDALPTPSRTDAAARTTVTTKNAGAVYRTKDDLTEHQIAECDSVLPSKPSQTPSSCTVSSVISDWAFSNGGRVRRNPPNRGISLDNQPIPAWK